MRKGSLSCGWLAFVGLALGSSAHDFWIEPSSFAPAPQSTLTCRLRIGDNFIGEAYARDPELLERFILAQGDALLPLTGEPGAEPAGQVVPPQAGQALVAYTSLPFFVELEATKFEEYLWKEGLEAAVRFRHENGARAQSGREVFSRCAKTLLQVGGSGSNGFDRVLGLRLEIIPERDPVSVPAGGPLPVRLLWDGQPCSNLLITAISSNRPERRIQGRTDAAGRTVLTLPDRSTWLIKTVYIQRTSDHVRADWESFWASYLFHQP